LFAVHTTTNATGGKAIADRGSEYCRDQTCRFHSAPAALLHFNSQVSSLHGIDQRDQSGVEFFAGLRTQATVVAQGFASSSIQQKSLDNLKRWRYPDNIRFDQ
jgi:hypothetical protein